MHVPKQITYPFYILSKYLVFRPSANTSIKNLLYIFGLAYCSLENNLLVYYNRLQFFMKYSSIIVRFY